MVYVGKQRLYNAVARGVSAYNAGTKQITSGLKKLGVEVYIISTMYEDHHDSKRILNLAVKWQGTEKKKIKSHATKRRELSL